MTISSLKNFIPLFIVLFLVSCKGPENTQWALQGGGDSYDGGRGLAIDSKGNVYVVGRYQGSAMFGDKTITGRGDDGVFLVKYNSLGDILWAKEGGSKADDSGYDISIDKNDNIYIAGYFSDTAFFDSQKLVTQGESDAYVAKYDSSGNVIWVKQAGGKLKDVARSVATDAEGNCYVAGYFTGTIVFDTTQINSNGFQEDIFVVCYDAKGNIKWAKNAGGKGNDRSLDLTLDKEGNFYITGSFDGTAYFDSISINSTGVLDMFVAKYNKEGKAVWAKRGGGSAADESRGVTVDNENNVYVTGYFIYEMDFDSTKSTILKSKGDRDIFIAKYGADGNLLWARSAGGPDLDESHYVISANNNGCMLTGFFGPNASFENSTLECKGVSDLFVAHYSADGKLLSLFTAGSKGVDEGRAVQILDKDYYYLTGNYDGQLILDEIKVPESRGDGDMFVARLRLAGSAKSQVNK